MRLYIPPPLERFDQHNERDMRDALTRAMIPMVSQDEAVPYLHLQSPDGCVWKVTVGNDGLLVSTKVQG